MVRGNTLVALGLVAALLSPAEAWTERRDADDWRDVQALERGMRITVLMRDGTVAKGRVAAADGDQVTLQDGASARVLARADVYELRKGKRSIARKIAGVLLGAVTGALIGGLAGGTAGQCSSCNIDEGLVRFAFGFLIGTLAGAVAGGVLASKGGGGVVYRAP